MGPGTPLARTRVTRCLIGKRGITYKYLGLRMFAFPWRGSKASAACAQMRKMSRRLARRAEACGAAAGSARFNLVLLNRMAPEAAPKQEKVYGMGGVSVSWHADSSLQDFSAISVYVAEHAARDSNFASPPPPPAPPGGGGGAPWRVALRVVRDVEGPTMRAALQSGKEGARKTDDSVTPAVLCANHDGDA